MTVNSRTREEIADRLEALTVVDVRTPGEFAGGHLPGAYNVPLSDLDRALDTLGSAAAARELLFVCASGGRSQTAHETLRRAGVESAWLQGGTDGWRAAGLRIEEPAAPARQVWPMERQVRFAAGSLVLAGLLGGRALSPKVRAVSAFVGAGLVYSGVSGTCGMALALGKLPFNRESTHSLDETLRALAHR